MARTKAGLAPVSGPAVHEYVPRPKRSMLKPAASGAYVPPLLTDRSKSTVGEATPYGLAAVTSSADSTAG